MGLTKALRRRYVCRRVAIISLSNLLGWNKKMSYCIAFSTHGATDVTRRYVRNFAKCGIPRTRVSEVNLIYILREIRDLRRESLAKEERLRLLRQDEHEEKELEGYIVQDITQELIDEPTSSSDDSMTRFQAGMLKVFHRKLTLTVISRFLGTDGRKQPRRASTDAEEDTGLKC